jgi:hypothetical protein
MFERFTDRARRAIVLAQEEARMLNHNYIGTEHILLGLIHEGEGVAATALESLGISLDVVRQKVEELIDRGQEASPRHISFTPRAKKALELSLREALRLGHNYIGTEHILLGLIREGYGVGARVLVELGANQAQVSEQVIQLLHGYQGKEPPPLGGDTARPHFPSAPFLLTLDRFSTLIQSGPSSSSAIGRENDISQILQVLSRRTKNNPVLVGESAAAKSALVEAFAQRLLSTHMLHGIKYRLVYKLDLDALLADEETNLEDSLSGILRDLERNPQIILIADNLPAYLSAQTDGPTADAASILRPLFARGKLQILGTTTADHFRRLVEPDALLTRSLQPIEVSDLSAADTLTLLKHLRAENQYTNSSDISITDGALTAAVILAQKYASSVSISAAPAVIVDASKVISGLDDSEPDERPSAQAIRLIDKALEQQQEKELTQANEFTVTDVDEESIFSIVASVANVSVVELRKIVDSANLSLAVKADALDRYQPYVLLNDQPLNNVDDDLLGTDNVAAGIASLLTASRLSSPFVVGLDAGWGMGKSTLLRQIGHRLGRAPGDGIKVIHFNAWTAGDGNALEGLIKSVLVRLDRHTIRRHLRQIAEKRRLMLLAKIGLSVMTRFFGITRLVDELWDQLSVDARTRNQLRDEIYGMLSDWASRVGNLDSPNVLVVFIDDLDRCTDEVVVQVCEAVKLYLDAPGLVFVIACDLSVIARSVSASARGSETQGRIYLEKIVQVIYHLPPPDEAQLNELIEGYALQSGTAALIDGTVSRILIESAGRNPRRIKRIINSIVLENQLNPAWSLPPLNRPQLVTAILLQHLYPSFYDLLIDETSSEDPVGDFLDYVKILGKAPNPPALDDAWWSIAKRIFERYGVHLPETTLGNGHDLMTDIERLEPKLPSNFSALAHNSAFIALLRGIGDSGARIALRSQLMRRPLTADANPIASTVSLDIRSDDERGAESAQVSH